jgi:hypothetical protein
MKRHVFLALSCAAAVIGSGIAARAEEQSARRGPNRQGVPQGDQDRAALEERLNNTWNAMPLEEKARAMRLHRGLRELPPDERKFINERIDHVLKMSPQEREKLRQNYQRWQEMTPEERQRAREEFRKHRKEFEEKWRKEHPGEELPPFPFRGGAPPNPRPPPPTQEGD